MGRNSALAIAPGIRYVGWDKAHTKAGWSILEGDFEGEFGVQFVFKIGLKSELEHLIGWKPNVEFWWSDPIATTIQ